MIFLRTQSSGSPAKVVIEHLPNGVRNVRLSGEVDEVETEEGGTGYVYDEVVFELPEDRDDTVESITQNFDAWWEFGQQESEEITLEQRVSDLEEALMALLEG